MLRELLVQLKDNESEWGLIATLQALTDVMIQMASIRIVGQGGFRF